MEPFTIVTQAISNMTNGMITDLTTVIIAILALILIVFSVSLIKDIMLGTKDSQSEGLRKLNDKRDSYSRTDIESEIYKAQYTKGISQTSKKRF